MLCETFVTDSCFLLADFVCLKFAHGKYVERNQRVRASNMVLRTILSTELVQNSGVIGEPDVRRDVGLDSCRPRAATAPGEETICIVFGHGNLFVKNQ